MLVQQLLVASLVALTHAAPHRDSPQQRLQAGLELPDKFLTSKKTSKQNPYTPDFRDPYDNKVDPVKDDLDPLPWRNGLGASVLGPWNPERSRQSPDLVRPPSTDHGNMANMRWSFADSHVRIEVRLSITVFNSLPPSPHEITELTSTVPTHRKEDGPARPPFGSCPPLAS